MQNCSQRREVKPEMHKGGPQVLYENRDGSSRMRGSY